MCHGFAVTVISLKRLGSETSAGPKSGRVPARVWDMQRIDSTDVSLSTPLPFCGSPEPRVFLTCWGSKWRHDPSVLRNVVPGKNIRGVCRGLRRAYRPRKTKSITTASWDQAGTAGQGSPLPSEVSIHMRNIQIISRTGHTFLAPGFPERKPGKGAKPFYLVPAGVREVSGATFPGGFPDEPALARVEKFSLLGFARYSGAGMPVQQRSYLGWRLHYGNKLWRTQAVVSGKCTRAQPRGSLVLPPAKGRHRRWKRTHTPHPNRR